MKIVVVGGSGRVGSMVLRTFAQHGHVRVADLRVAPSRDSMFEYLATDVTDADSLRLALADQDVLVYLAMGTERDWGAIGGWAESQFDVNVKGLYLALQVAAEVGIRRALFASSLSVFEDLEEHGRELEDGIPNAVDGYGLSKRLGELVCEAACHEHEMDIIALRLCAPLPDKEFHAYNGEYPEIRTAASDVAAAFEAALTRPGRGFEHFTICGDIEEKTISWPRTRRELGWHPTQTHRG